MSSETACPESHSIAVELIEWKLFWVAESENCLTRSKLYRRELGSSSYREKPISGGLPRFTDYIITK